MAEPKTKPTAQSPKEFLEAVAPAQKRDDSLALLRMFEEATGEKAVMWGSSIVGFGVYEIRKGKQVNEWPLVGFSPRKQNLTLYIRWKGAEEDPRWQRLGKHKVSGSCLHIHRLADVDADVLAALVRTSFEENARELAKGRSTEKILRA